MLRGPCTALVMFACLAGLDHPAGAQPENATSAAEVEPAEPAARETRRPDGLPAIPHALVCRGNEPFWLLRIDGADATLERLGSPPKSLSGVRADAPWLRPPVAVWRGRPPTAAADLVAVISDERCQGSMSGINYPQRVVLSTVGGEVLTGCCEPGGRAVAADASALPLEARGLGWWEAIPELIGPIDACLAEAPGAEAVSSVEHNTAGQLTVRLTGPADRRYRCRLDADGDALHVVDWEDSDIWRPGETSVLFTRAPGAPPAGGCFDHERIVAEDGRLLGWLSHDQC